MKYFHMSNGLRGCYMPDNAGMIAVKTRRELKEAIAGECEMLRTDGTIGWSKQAIAAFAATMWHDAQQKKPASLPHCLPCKERGQSYYSYGLFLSTTTRREYLEWQKENDQ